DLVIVPGMAFTESGNRMGFGGGYYDRFLETIRNDCHTAALVREDFIYDAIPMEAHDKSVDTIITEKRCKSCQ
ncbi:MAG: 5-formyltetrahydrofolate cyclo-ligase, partial [Eubacterium sp.]